MKTIQWAALAACALLVLATAACKKAGTETADVKPEPTVDKTTPEFACSSQEAKDTVASIVMDEARRLAGEDADSAAEAEDTIQITMIRIAGTQPDIKKVSCEAQFGLLLPEEARRGLPFRNMFAEKMSEAAIGSSTHVPEELTRGDGSGITLLYERQATADGTGYVYMVSNVRPMAVAVVRAGQAMVAYREAGSVKADSYIEGDRADDAAPFLSAAYKKCVEPLDDASPLLLACVEPEHRQQDADLNATYKQAMAKLTPEVADGLRQEQRAWIGERDSTCADDDAAAKLRCETEVTAIRVGALRSKLGGGQGGSR